MVYVPSEYFDQFMDPLVGSEAAVEEFKAGLTAQVSPHADSPDAYNQLLE